ncbi:hypothetical protein BDN72DRAFT_745795, partial [Pluteus cervinus]
MTVHRAQGMTMERVIVDLKNCTGSEAPYVMISRAKTLAGLKVLRLFEWRVITKRLSQDLREEFERV